MATVSINMYTKTRFELLVISQRSQMLQRIYKTEGFMAPCIVQSSLVASVNHTNSTIDGIALEVVSAGITSH